MSRQVTIFGAAGFIGQHLYSRLSAKGEKVFAVTRQNWPEIGSYLGDVIFAIGMNANFRGRPFETYEAHIDRLRQVLTQYKFKSLLYVSSTRVYLGAASTHEFAPLMVQPTQMDQIFNISKLAGEALCLSVGEPVIRIARLSNVYGANDRSDVFLTSVLREAIQTGSVLFRTAPNSAKDYIHIDDAIQALIQISSEGHQPIYNIASGYNTSNQEIAAQLENLGVSCRFAENAPEISFEPINTRALQESLGLRPAQLVNILPNVFMAMKASFKRSALNHHSNQ